jgi:hypothetical protein
MKVPILAALVLSVAACTMQTDVPAPASYIAAKHPRSIWVETRSATVRLDRPSLVRDSLVGMSDGRPLSISLADVTGVTARSIDWPVTDALIVGGAAVAWFTFTPSNDHSTTGAGCPCVQTMPGLNMCAC